MKNALIVFVRKPEWGKVKTRLAATVGNDVALDIYKELLQHTFNIVKSTPFTKFICYVNEIEKDDLWNAEGFVKRLQSETDLGSKMKDAFSEVLNEGYKKAVIIGSDCMDLTTAIIVQAFDLLETKDTVIGPAKDGGYYLLGMKNLSPFIFKDKNWSTSSVYNDTVIDMEANGISFGVLPLLNDVDTEDDWLSSKK